MKTKLLLAAALLTTALSPLVLNRLQTHSSVFESTNVSMLAVERAEEYNPPDNGGPSKTGGSGTRWW